MRRRNDTWCLFRRGAAGLALIALAGCRDAAAPLTASAVIEAARPAAGGEAEGQAPDPAALAAAADAQARLLASDGVLEEAVRRLRRAGALARWLAGPDAVERLRAGLAVERGAEPALLVACLTAPRRDRPHETLREVLAAYLDAAQRDHRAAWAARVRDLQAACGDLRDQLAAHDRALPEFLARHGLLTLDAAASEPAARLGILEKDLREKEAALAALEARQAALADLKARAAQAADPAAAIAADAAVAAAIREDPQLAARQRRADALQAALEELRRRFGPQADAVKETEADLAAARRELGAERRAVPARVLGRRLAGLAIEAEQARRQAAELRAAAGQARAQADEYARRVREYLDLQRRRDETERALAAREKERLRAVLALSEPPVRIVQWP